MEKLPTQMPAGGTDLYMGFYSEQHVKDYKARGIAKPKTHNFGCLVPRSMYEELSLYRDYRQISWLSLLSGLWRRYKAELENAGHWPPVILEDGEREYLELESKKRMNEAIARADAERAKRRF